MIAPHLTFGNADELVASATHKTRAEIELLLAECFPRPDLPERLQVLSSPPLPGPFAAPQFPAPACELAPEQVESTIPAPFAAPVVPAPVCQLAPEQVESTIPAPFAAPVVPAPVCQLAPEQVESTIPAPGALSQAGVLARPARQLAPEQAAAPAPRPKMTPLAPERFGLQVTIDQETQQLLRQAQALMSHQIPAGEIAPVLKSALRLLVAHLEKRRFAATARPAPSRPCTSARHVPSAVKREVWARDGGRCTFVSENGRRCPAREMLEYDHREPVARGGEATAENLQLRCRAHNAYAAERAFGAGFMERKLAEARAKRIPAAAVPARCAPRPPGDADRKPQA